MLSWKQLAPAALALMLFSGCATQENVKQLVGWSDDEDTTYSGPEYPATSKIAIAFQPAQVGQSCRVFAQSLVTIPANMNGKQIKTALLAEAGQRGADQILIGCSREAEDDEGLNFLYFRPAAEYLCTDQCGGWKYGYEVWEEQGGWVSLGYGELGREEAHFESPMVTQMLLLRCQ
ncbi:hypothetical protein JWJ90_13935 [Desulfobulbus rhabdoformis]|uniref:hypothetical protein n=1 Tax=Desulfobulbus rhabdoformis TaxID=34032 RepID=UPI0019630F62|nr:hypothetical protein [Desulfobulbus rhabdoformis]MBM9615380.1 hypothetical protein [Desulfobulbus rhabdoformis]